MKRWMAVFLLLVMVIPAAAGAEGGSVYQWVWENEDQNMSLYLLGDTGWLVESARQEKGYTYRTGAQAEAYRAFAEECGAKLYVYLVNSSRSLDFDNLQREPYVWTLLRECYPDCELGCLEIDSIETYCDYFHKTDHHWNYRGAYQGYADVIRLLLGEDEPLMQPVETVTFPFMFNGSYNKDMERTDSDEAFTVYRFDYPDMKIQINGRQRKEYGRAELFFEGRMNDMPVLTNYYSEFYGGDTGLIVFSTGNEDRESVMIVSNSYSNAINKLVACHFNNTVVVDPRMYDSEADITVTQKELAQEYGVTKILLLGDAFFFR